MNIAQTMRDSLAVLNEGLNGIRFKLKPECEDRWNTGYAIVKGLYYDYPDSDYFDHDSFRQDYMDKVKAIFPDVNVKFYWQSQEIEVYK